MINDYNNKWPSRARPPHPKEQVRLPEGYSNIVQDICHNCRKFNHRCVQPYDCLCDICHKARYRKQSLADTAETRSANARHWTDPIVKNICGPSFGADRDG